MSTVTSTILFAVSIILTFLATCVLVFIIVCISLDDCKKEFTQSQNDLAISAASILLGFCILFCSTYYFAIYSKPRVTTITIVNPSSNSSNIPSANLESWVLLIMAWIILVFSAFLIDYILKIMKIPKCVDKIIIPNTEFDKWDEFAMAFLGIILGLSGLTICYYTYICIYPIFKHRLNSIKKI